MKKVKILISIGVIAAVVGIGAYSGYKAVGGNKNMIKVEENTLLAQASNLIGIKLTPEEVSYNNQINKIQDENVENTDSHIKVTSNMKTTTKPIEIANGCVIPQGTFEAPILLHDGNYHTDYLITGMVTSDQNIPVYNNILDGSGPIETYPAGTNLLVVGYVDGYYILGSGAGDVNGLGYKRDTYVNASDMTLIPNESNLCAITLGEMPYTVDFVQNSNNNQSMKLYKYPTDLSPVVGVINSSQLSANPSNNEAKVVNTGNKMQDISFDGKSGWVLTSNEFPFRYVSSTYSPNNDGND
ncbi:MAG: hypothetical protein ACRCTZ_01030 [Sarcina sp.]